MDTAEQATGRPLRADEFLETDQRAFGDAWRYELVDGVIIAHAAPSPDHGAILTALGAALLNRLRGRKDGCRPETGSGAVPKRQQRNTARIPDVLVRCGEHPRVVFEVISPTELRHRKARDRKRRDEQDTPGVEEIVEIFQDDAAAHIYRREAAGTWSFDAIEGLDTVLKLRSIGIEIPLAELYETIEVASQDEESGQPST